MDVSLRELLLERDVELRAIDDAIVAACRGDGGLLLVEAAAGLGKTRLLGIVGERARERGVPTFAARANELKGDFAWGVVRQLYERLLATAAPRERRRLLADAAGLAALALDLGEAGPAEAETLGDHRPAVSDLLGAGDLAERCGVHNPAFVWWRSAASLSLTALGERQ